MERIEAGDIVDVYFEYTEPELHVTVLYTPQATGDAFSLRRDDGTIVGVQTYTKMVRLVKGKTLSDWPY